MTAQLAIDYAATDNQPNTPDFAVTKTAGARMIIIRAIYGRGTNGPTRDPFWARDHAAIVAAGLRRSAYLLLCMPRPGMTTPEPEDQAQAFIDYVGEELSARDAHNFVPCLDVEEQSSLSSSAYFDWVLRAAVALRRHYGVWPAMYSSARVWQEYLNGHASGLLQNCPLWIAKPWPWPTRTPVHLDGASNYRPSTIPQFGDETNWVLYQYQGDATLMPGFAPGICDASRCQMVAEGARGTIVSWIQARVGVLIDGVFGPNTKAAVETIQREHGLTADGIVGIDTFCVLAWLRPAPVC